MICAKEAYNNAVKANEIVSSMLSNISGDILIASNHGKYNLEYQLPSGYDRTTIDKVRDALEGSFCKFKTKMTNREIANEDCFFIYISWAYLGKEVTEIGE